MIEASFVGNNEVMLKLDAMPSRVRERLTVRVVELELKLEAKVKDEKLSGQVLKVRTGALRRSIHHHSEINASEVAGIVGSYGIKYAAYHEYGFQGSEQVREHMRHITQAFGRPISPRDVVVHAFTRHVDYPARSFLRTSLHEMSGEIEVGLTEAVNEGMT